MKLAKIKQIEKSKKRCFDLTVENNHNFFCNNALIHNCDYREEVGVILFNSSNEEHHFKKGDRIAQLVFAKYNQVIFHAKNELDETTRIGGFGSTELK